MLADAVTVCVCFVCVQQEPRIPSRLQPLFHAKRAAHALHALADRAEDVVMTSDARPTSTAANLLVER